jgi:hypothetical protein
MTHRFEGMRSLSLISGLWPALLVLGFSLLGAAPAVAQWYPDDHMYACNWRFISGPRAGASGQEQRWIFTAGNTTQRTGFSRVRYSPTNVTEHNLTLDKLPWHTADQWRARVPEQNITCDLFQVLDDNRYEFRRCSNGVELDCTRRNARGGTYTAIPVLTESAIFDAHESGGTLQSLRGYMYFTAAGNPKTGNLGDLRCIAGECYDDNAWASNFRGPVRQPSGGRIQWEWSIDPVGNNAQHLCLLQCNQLCFLETGDLDAITCNSCRVNTSLECAFSGPSDRRFGRVTQVSRHRYPFVWGVRERSQPQQLGAQRVTIKEHDPGPLQGDDTVGHFTLRQIECRGRVWNRGRKEGWTEELTAAREGDVAGVTYKLRCEFTVNDPGWVL